MKFVHHPMLVAAALSMFGCFSVFATLLSPDHLWAYHYQGSPNSIYGAVLLSFGLGVVAFSAILRIASWRRSMALLVWTAIALYVPMEAIEQGAKLDGWNPSHAVRQTILITAVVACAAGVLAWRRWPRAFEQFRAGLIGFLGIAGIASLLIVAEFLWAYGQAFALERVPVLRHETSPSAAIPHTGRVIWIVLDELSFQQVFGARYGHLNLPEFDRMAAQSVVFTQVVPVSKKTQTAIPGMFVGLPVVQARANARGDQLTLKLVDGQRMRLDPEDTIFGDAVRMGDTTGVAGWYHPYCRILGPVLDRCTWSLHDDLMGMNPDHNPLLNALVPWRHVLNAVDVHREGVQATVDHHRSEHIQDYKVLVPAGDALLADSSVDFVYLHMPFPHPPGFYDAGTGRLTTEPSSYLDNLALADRYIGHIRRLLAGRGEWDSSTVLITGDHSWRTILFWRDGADWTAAEQAASGGGRYDSRPAWILKLPGEKTGATIDTPFDAVHARTVIRKLLSGELKTPAELRSFVSQLPAPPSKGVQDSGNQN
jgi:hypothetical protein